MKTATKILAAAGVAVLLSGNPLLAGESKTFKEEVIIEESRKWWGASLSTGWDSLYMFRGVNVLRNDSSYGSGLYWTDLNFTWNITDNDFLTVGTWFAFGTQNTDYKELDVYTSYTHMFGDFALSFGYIFYYVLNDPLYSHELNVSGAYEFDLGFMTITPSLTYFFNIGPDVDDDGIAPTASSYLLARVDGSVPVTNFLSIDPWVSFGTNFRYNAKEDGSFFNGANDLQVGLGVPIALNEYITVYGYGAYSYQWENLVNTRPSTFWGGASVEFSF